MPVKILSSLQSISARFWAIVIGVGLVTTGMVATFIQRLEQRNLQANFVKVAEDDFFATQANLRYCLEAIETVRVSVHSPPS